jgi:mRNA interferase MazF
MQNVHFAGLVRIHLLPGVGLSLEESLDQSLVLLPRSHIVRFHLTTQIKNYPFEVAISAENPSAVLADQVKSLDWQKRRAGRKGVISAAELAEVRA